MVSEFPADPGRIVVAGDWHGAKNRSYVVIEYAGNTGVPVVLHLGDFGFWVPGRATDHYLDHVEKTCAAFDVTLLWVDGNHEAHPTLNNIPLNDDGVRPIRDHILHLPRGFRWTWGVHTWMALGGAHSVDRKWRTEGRDWWPEETLTEADVQRAVSGGPVDVIAAHDSPDGTDLASRLRSGVFPDEDIVLAKEHRRQVGRVVDATRPGALFHGHYHLRHTTYRNLPGGGRTVVIGLASDSESLRGNSALVDLSDPFTATTL